jgi:prepilin-type N-terminal cleavage/methylation domain-containing protein
VRHNEHGFTLVEVVIAVGILVLLTGAMATAVVVYLNTTDETAQRLTESPDVQIAAAYFGQDVQSSSTFTTTCGTIAVGATRLLDLSWTDPGSAPESTDDGARTASYVVATVGNQKQLLRYYCTPTVVNPSPTTLVDFVDPSTTPMVTCSTGTVDGACSTATTQIRTSVQVCTTGTTTACESEPFTFELKAERRLAS